MRASARIYEGKNCSNNKMGTGTTLNCCEASTWSSGPHSRNSSLGRKEENKLLKRSKDKVEVKSAEEDEVEKGEDDK